MKRAQKKLDRIFSEYSEERGFEHKLLKYKTKEVLVYCKGRDILDVGCGVGILTKALATKNRKVIGIDGSSEKIDIARRENNTQNITYKCVLFEDYKPKSRFNRVIMTNVLEHVKDPVKFLKKTKTWLKPKGKVIITVPNALALHKRLGKEMGLIKDYYKLTKADKKKGHFKNYDMTALNKDLTMASFSCVRVSGFFLKPFASNQMEQYSDSVLDGLYRLGKQFPELCSSLIAVGQNEI